MKSKKKLWIFSFEYSGIKKVGGLGEVPANQTKWLKKYYDITLFMPSHGVHYEREIVKKLNLHESGILFKINGGQKNLSNSVLEDKLTLSFIRGSIDDVKVILIQGCDDYSSSIINDPIVYAPGTLNGKIKLFALGIKNYIQHLIKQDINLIPDIVHCHDYHSIPSTIVMKQKLMEYNRKVATVFTVHLMTYPRYPIEFLWDCGIEDKKISVYIGNEYKNLTPTELFMYCRGNDHSNNPTLEKIGAFFSDVVTSVSEDYLKSEIVPNLGGGWINGKSDFFWNGCDWNYESNLREVLYIFKEGLMELDPVNWKKRSVLRKFLLTKGLGVIPNNEPIVESNNIQNFIQNNLTKFPYKPNKNGEFKGHIHPFSEDGPLIITTGRLSKQKGIDILIDALPNVIEKFPDVKFVLFLMPSVFSINEIKEYRDLIQEYPNNIRILFGRINSIFKLLYHSADVYCAPSRWEPFGIIALEAMISKIPIVASKIGGLQESIVDLRENIEKGTGLLVPSESPNLLSQALIDMISILKIDELNKTQSKEFKFLKISDLITHEILNKKVNSDRAFGTKIRENCKKRVENNFRWEIVTKKLIQIYEDALNTSKNS